MIPLSLAQIARVTGGQLCHGDPDAVVSGEVVIDSRVKRDEGARSLAPMGIGLGDDRDLAHGGVAGKNFLDLKR